MHDRLGKALFDYVECFAHGAFPMPFRLNVLPVSKAPLGKFQPIGNQRASVWSSGNGIRRLPNFRWHLEWRLKQDGSEPISLTA